MPYDAPGLHHKHYYPNGKPTIDQRHDWCFLITPFSYLKGTAVVSCPEPVIFFTAVAFYTFGAAGWDATHLQVGKPAGRARMCWGWSASGPRSSIAAAGR
jgi:hypothetical protein